MGGTLFVHPTQALGTTYNCTARELFDAFNKGDYVTFNPTGSQEPKHVLVAEIETSSNAPSIIYEFVEDGVVEPKTFAFDPLTSEADLDKPLTVGAVNKPY